MSYIFSFFSAESTKIRLFQAYFIKIIVSRDSSMKEFELKFSKFCFFSAFKSQ